MAPRCGGAGRARGLVGCIAVAVAVGVGVLPSARAASTLSAAESTPPTVASAQGTITRTIGYTIPSVRLVRDDGKVVSLADELNDGRPVVLNFIFTTCSSICPVMSQVFSQLDRKLGEGHEPVHLVSISVDPEADTPARLREYAQKFHAGSDWNHYTGTVQASIAAQRAFNVFRGEKMNHAPVTFVRASPGDPWLRIDGFVTPDDLLQRFRQLTEAPGQKVATR